MDIDSEKLIYRKLSHNDIDLFKRLRLDFIGEFHKDVDEEEKDKIKISLENYFKGHIEKDDFIGIICEYSGEIISVAFRAYPENCVNDHDMVEIPKERIWSWHERGRRRKRTLSTKCSTISISGG
jgi:hypothetical protein